MKRADLPDLAQVPYFNPDQDSANQWPDPCPLDNKEPPLIPTTLLPDWLGEYAKAVCASIQIPEDFGVSFALAVLGTCLQKSIEVSPKGDDYIETASLWTLARYPSGGRKSELVKKFMAPIIKWERERELALRSQIDAIETERTITLKTIERLQSDAVKAKDPHDRELALRDIAKLKESMPEPLVAPLLWVDDCTCEQLQNIIAENRERMAFLSDESSGFFEVLAGLYNDGKSNLDIYLKGHAGSPCRVERGSRKVRLNAPALSLGLAIQPGVPSDLGSKKRFRDTGVLARFLFFCPRSTIGHRNIRDNAKVPDELKYRYEAQINRLLSLQENTDPIRLTLSPESREDWFQFCEYIEQNIGDGRPFGHIQDWCSKLTGAVARIAGVFHACETFESTTIELPTMQKATALGRLLIPHTLFIFDQMGTEQRIEDARYVSAWIVNKNLASFKTGDLYALHRFKNSNKERISSMIGVLAERMIIDHGTVVQTGGRPAHLYRVNPKYLASSKDRAKGAYG